MPITIENNLKSTEDSSIFKQQVHYIPCKIEDNGPASVEKYFEPYVIATSDGDLKATFRGYPLEGTRMSLPEGYRAVVATETKRPLAEDVERKFQIVGGFTELTYWNWDKKPSKNDNLVKAMDWIDISEAIHGD